MQRTVLAALGLGFAGAMITGGAGGAAASLAAGLAGGVASNLATDIFRAFDRRACERFLDGWSGLDENHHIVAALRLAEIAALRAVLARFKLIATPEYDRSGQPQLQAFVKHVETFLARETDIAQRRAFGADATPSDDDIRGAVLNVLPDAFDRALAARRDDPNAPRSSLTAYRSASEAAVLAELRAEVGDSGQIPDIFEQIFSGEPDQAGWFDLFVRSSAEKLAEPNSTFGSIWQAEQVALVRAITSSALDQLGDIDLKLEALVASFQHGLESLQHDKAALAAVSERIDGKINSLQSTTTSVMEAVDRLPASIIDRLLAALASQDAAVPGTAGVAPSPAALVTPPVRCRGRSAERDMFTSVLSRADQGIAAIVYGGPGLGKTTLTREIASAPALIGHFGDRRYFVRLEGATDAARLRSAVAKTLGMRERDSLAETFAGLGQMPALLILDNLDTPWQNDPTAVEHDLQDCLDRCPQVVLLASFRGHELPAAPRWTHRELLSPLEPGVARALFLEVAPWVSPSDQHLDELLAALGGVPLAIELTALASAGQESLDLVWKEWQRVGTAVAKRRNVTPTRLSSLDMSIELTLLAPNRHPNVSELLMMASFLNDGALIELVESAFGEETFALISDAIGCGLCFRCEGRINALPPIRVYASSHLGITHKLLDNFVSLYLGVIQQSLNLDNPSALVAFIDREEFNVPLALMIAVHRRAAMDMRALLCRFIDALELLAKHGVETQHSRSIIRIAATCSRIVQHYVVDSIAARDPVEFSKMQYYGLMAERIVDELQRVELYKQLDLMRCGLSDCAPDVRADVAAKLDELQVVYDNYYGSIPRLVDLPTDERESLQAFWDFCTDDAQKTEAAARFFDSESEVTQISEHQRACEAEVASFRMYGAVEPA
jgi:hypothetical protein